MFACEERNWLLEKCVFTHYIALCHIRVPGDFVVCYKNIIYNLYTKCKGFFVFFFLLHTENTHNVNGNRQNDRSRGGEDRKHMYATLPEGR